MIFIRLRLFILRAATNETFILGAHASCVHVLGKEPIALQSVRFGRLARRMRALPGPSLSNPQIYTSLDNKRLIVLLTLGCLIGAVVIAQDTGSPTAVERGRQLYEQKRCNTCHSLDGSAGPGTTFKGVYGSQRTLESGETVTADEAYLTESIANPLAKVVKGYSAISMFTTNPPGSLTDEQIKDLVAFIKSLKEPQAMEKKKPGEKAP